MFRRRRQLGWRHFLSSILFLLIAPGKVHSLESATLDSSRAVKPGTYVELTCKVPLGQNFDPSTVVYRFNGKAVNVSKFDAVATTGPGEQTLKILQADLSHNGTYTCQPEGFKESNRAIIYILTDDPTIDIRGRLIREINEGSSLYLVATVFYQADSVTLSVVHKESGREIPGSIRRVNVFTNLTVSWNLTEMSRFDEGTYYVKGMGNLLSTNAKFQSAQSIKIVIIRKPNKVQISKKVIKKDHVDLGWNQEPSDPDHQYDPVMYYRVQWKQFTKYDVFEPNVVIVDLGVCEDFQVVIVAVGNRTESDGSSTTIRTGLDPDRPIGFFRDPESEAVYASVGDKELPVCVYRDSYLCHPTADIEMRRRRTNVDGNYYYLFNFNETESHRRKEPVSTQCPVVVSTCDESSLVCRAPSDATNDTSRSLRVILGVVLSVTTFLVIVVALFLFFRWWRKRKFIRAVAAIIFSEWEDTFRAIEPSLNYLKDGDAFTDSISKRVSERSERNQNKIDEAKRWAASKCLRQWMKENPRNDSISAVHDALVKGVQNNEVAERLRKRFPQALFYDAEHRICVMRTVHKNGRRSCVLKIR